MDSVRRDMNNGGTGEGAGANRRDGEGSSNSGALDGMQRYRNANPRAVTTTQPTPDPDGERLTRGLYDRLTDALLWTTLEQSVFPRLPEAFSFVVTGVRADRWARRISSEHPRSNGVFLADTPEAARAAHALSVRAGRDHQVRHVAAAPRDLADVLGTGGHHLVLHDRSPLSAYPDPGEGLRTLAALLAPGGLLVSFLPSRWHTALEYLGTGDLQAALRSLAGRDPHSAAAPHAHLFTPGQLRLLHISLDLGLDALAGFPSLVLPASSASYQDFLGDENVYTNVLKMERELLIDPDSVARGVNLLTVASQRG